MSEIMADTARFDEAMLKVEGQLESYIGELLAIELAGIMRAHPDYRRMADEDEHRILFGDPEAKDAPGGILNNRTRR